MKLNKLIIALAIAAAFTGTAFAKHHHGGPRPVGGPLRPGDPRLYHHGPSHHGGHGFHHRPPVGYHGWRRGPIHPHYRSCWYGGVWYDASGYAYYAPAGYVYPTTTTIVQPVQTVVQPAVVQPAVVQPAVVQPAVVQPAVVQPAAPVQPSVVTPQVQQTVVPTAY